MRYCDRCGAGPAIEALGDTGRVFCAHCARVLQDTADYWQCVGSTPAEAVAALARRYPIRSSSPAGTADTDSQEGPEHAT